MTGNPELEENIRKYEEACLDGKTVFLDVDDLTDIAEYYHSKGDTAKALEVVDYAIRLFPGSTLPLCFKAREAIADNDYEQAERLAEEIEDKSDVEYKFLKAEILIAKGKESAADILMDEEFRITDETEKDLFAIDTAQMFFDYGLYDLALQWLHLCRNRAKVEYKELESKIATARGQFEQSEKILNQLLDRNPFSTEYWNMLASSQFLNNDIARSLESTEYALAIDSDNSEAVLIKANALFVLENWNEAQKYFERYSTMMPNSEIGEMFIGTCLSHQEKFTEAISHLERALTLCLPSSPNILQIYKELVFCYSFINDKEKNIDKALSYISKAEEHPDSDAAELSCLRGICYMSDGQKEKAMEWFTKAMSEARQEQLSQICIDAAASALDCKSPELAYSILHKMFYENGMDYLSDGWGYYALACYQLKKEEEFFSALQKACQRNAKEAKQTLGWLFPENLPVEDYLSYYGSWQ